MPEHASTTVETNTYTARFYRRGEDLLFMQREVRHLQPDRDIDVFGNFWILSWGEIPPQMVFAVRDGVSIELKGRYFNFIPPFSVIEWNLAPGCFHFESLFGTAPLTSPENADALPLETVTFPWRGESLPENAAQALALVRAATELRAIGRCSNPPSLARRLKQRIDATYTEAIPIAQLASELGLSHTVAGRAFKRSFGLAPVAYRNKLRVFDSLRLMMLERTRVASAAFEVGFEDLSRYNRLFRRQMLTTPSSYR